MLIRRKILALSNIHASEKLGTFSSYVERFNLTLRQRVSYLQRKTLGYCKKKATIRVFFGLISMTTTIGATIKA
jgi:IS1 family transposase